MKYGGFDRKWSRQTIDKWVVHTTGRKAQNKNAKSMPGPGFMGDRTMVKPCGKKPMPC